MKSYFLHDVRNSNAASLGASLASVLPGQSNPWILFHNGVDPVAYFNVITDEDGERGDIIPPAICADISGRHYNGDQAVIDILSDIQKTLDGKIFYAP